MVVQEGPDVTVHRPPRATVARVRRFIRDHELLGRGDGVLLALSGGVDSTCLLLILAGLRRSLRVAVCAAHLDHGLRGRRTAAREERFVRSLCEELEVPLRCGAVDVRAHARAAKLSTEESARELRYRFLAEAADDMGCAAVAAGHTRSDQAETVLLHLIRGSGLRGLAAMAPEAPWPVAVGGDPPRLVRPLLSLTREDTEACCRAAGIEPVEDASNRSPAHMRNRVRHELLPYLRRFNPRIEGALARLADAAAPDVELLERLASEVVEAPFGMAGARLNRRLLAGMPAALQRHAVRLAASRALGDARGLSERHVRAVLRANAGPTGVSLDLPRRLRAEVRRDEIVLSTVTRRPTRLPCGEVELPVPGEALFGGWRFEARVARAASAGPRSKDPHTVTLDAEACAGRLWVRRRRRGDRFQPLGLGSPKKLQDFFVDAHVPRVERDAVPLVCGERGIAWVVGQRPAEWAKVGRAARRVLRITAIPPLPPAAIAQA